MNRLLLVIVATLLLVAACSNPASDQPRAVASNAAPAASPAVAGEKYSITPENSDIEFIGAKVTGKHNGSFEKILGRDQLRGPTGKESSKDRDRY